MPVNMIDIATMAPRSQEASQLQHNVIRHNENAQQQTGIQFNQERMHDSRQTVETAQSDQPEYRYGDRRGNGRQQQKESQKREEKKDEVPMAPRSTSSFDITI